MKLVFLHHFLAHRLKRAQPHVQRDLGGFDSTLANAIEDFLREVQARGGRCHRAKWLGINRLILFAIGWRVRTIDVGRQGYVSNTLQNSKEIVRRIEA